MTADYLFIVRHGETEANEKGIEAGPLDYPLTKRGVKGALFIAKTLSKVKITCRLQQSSVSRPRNCKNSGAPS